LKALSLRSVPPSSSSHWVKERNEATGLATARTDSLTGVANRAAFLESAERLLNRCRRDSAPVSVMMFDLDRFKAVNDRYGHAVGDTVIRKFCEVTAAALRPNDVFDCLGGEELGVVLPGSNIEAAHARAERIRVAFAASSRFVGNRLVDATVSCGLSACSDTDQTLNALLAPRFIAPRSRGATASNAPTSRSRKAACRP